MNVSKFKNSFLSWSPFYLSCLLILVTLEEIYGSEKCEGLGGGGGSGGATRSFVDHLNKHPHPHSPPLILSDLIEEGQMEEAREKARVHHIMGHIVSYSGFLTVNKEHDANLFFWFFPARFGSKTAPFILKAGGAPQQSNVFHMFLDTGPFQVEPNMKIRRRPHSAQLSNNILYMDVVIGAGHSFTKDEAGYPKNEEDVADNVYEALGQFFKLFPQGKVGPAIAAKIHRENHKKSLSSAVEENNVTKATSHPHINLKGLALGDGVLDEYPGQHMAEFLYSIHAVNNTGRSWFHSLELSAKRVAIRPHSLTEEDCWCDPSQHAARSNSFSVLAERLYREHRKHYLQNSGKVTLFPFLGLRWSNLAPSIRYAEQLIYDSHFRKAIHVDSRPMHRETDVMQHFKATLKKSVKPHLEELLQCKDCYRIIIFISKDGHIAPNIISGAFIKDLRWSGQAAFAEASKKSWHLRNREDPGYSVTSGSLTKLVVHKTGHFFPLQDRKIYLEIIEGLVNGKKF